MNDIANNQVLKTCRRIIDAFKAKQFQTALDGCQAFLTHRSNDTTVLFLGGSVAQVLGFTKICRAVRGRGSTQSSLD